MTGHIIVAGDGALGRRIIDELTDQALPVVALESPSGLAAAGVAGATAVIAADVDDSVNLEVALLAREANPAVRVVARLANPVLREALNDGIGPGAILDVADLSAPSVVEAVLGKAAHTVTAGGVRFVVASDTVPEHGTLRSIYGRLAPVAVVRGHNAPNPGEVITCPRLDDEVYQGDRATLIGRGTDLAERGLATGLAGDGELTRPSRPVRAFDGLRAFHEDVNPAFYWSLSVALTMLLGSAFILRFAIRPGIGWMDALSFATETLTTVGYGDFNFAGQPLWLRLWGVVMMLSGIALISVTVAFIADVLLSRRLTEAASRQRVSHLRHHVVVVGLGAYGIRVAGLLRTTGHAVAAVELGQDNRFLSAAEELRVPVITGDGTQRATLAAAVVQRARAVAVLTDDDMVNIEAGLVVRAMTEPDGAPDTPRIPIVLRIYDRALGAAVGHQLDFHHVRSTVDLATPWFIGAAMGLDVLGTFSVGQRSFMVGGVRVQPGSDLDGLRISDLSALTRVIAIERHDGTATELHPRLDTRFSCTDTVYLVGPYHELLDVLRKGQPGETAGMSATGCSGLESG